MMSSNDIIADLLEQAKNVIATLDRIAAKLADNGVNNQRTSPLLSPQMDDGKIVKPSVSHPLTDSRCKNDVKDSQIASILPENETTVGTDQVFDKISSPNSCLNVVSTAPINLDNGRSHEICWENKVNAVSGCRSEPIFSDEARSMSARNVLDEIPVPDFIRELAEAKKMEQETMVSSAHQVFDDLLSSKIESIPLPSPELKTIISAGLTLEHENTIIPTQIQHSNPFVKPEDQNVQAKCFICNGIESKSVLLYDTSSLFPTTIFEDKGDFKREGEYRSSNENYQIHTLLKAWRIESALSSQGNLCTEVWVENHLNVCCDVAIIKTVNSFPFDPGELIYNPAIFKTPEVVSTDQQGDAVVVVWVFDPGGYCNLLGVSSANMVITFRGNIKKSTTMVNLDPCANDQELLCDSCYSASLIYCVNPGVTILEDALYYRDGIILCTVEGFVDKGTVPKQYQNYKFQQPYHQAMCYCSLIMQVHLWPWMEQLDVLPHLKADTFSEFIPLMLSKEFMECYVAGKIVLGEAGSIIEHIERAFFEGSHPHPICRPLFPSQHLTNRVVKLNKGKNYCYAAKGLNASDENSALVHYVQVHQDDYVANVKLQLTALIAKRPSYHQLRSVEQLGYIVALLNWSDFGVNGLQVIIQSTAKGPKDIDARVEAVLTNFENEVRQLSDDEFKKNVGSLIEMKLEKHKNLREESRFLWKEITDGTFKFDRKEFKVEALKRLTRQELARSILQASSNMLLGKGCYDIDIAIDNMMVTMHYFNWLPLNYASFSKCEQNVTMASRVFDSGGYDSEPTMTKRPQVYPYGAKQRKFRRREDYQSYVFDPGGSLVLPDYKSVMLCSMEGVLSFILEDKDNFKGSVMIHTKNRSMGSLVICSLLISLLATI